MDLQANTEDQDQHVFVFTLKEHLLIIFHMYEVWVLSVFDCPGEHLPQINFLKDNPTLHHQ